MVDPKLEKYFHPTLWWIFVLGLILYLITTAIDLFIYTSYGWFAAALWGMIMLLYDGWAFESMRKSVVIDGFWSKSTNTLINLIPGVRFMHPLFARMYKK